MHILLYVLLLLKLLEEILDIFAIDWGPLERMNIPSAKPWELSWLSSLIPMTMCFLAMPKNKDTLMLKAYYGFFLCGLLPLAIGAGTLLPDLLDYVKNPKKDDVETILGFPAVVLSFMFIAVALQLHGFSMYFASHLVRIWRPREPKTPKPATSDNGSVDSLASDRKFK